MIDQNIKNEYLRCLEKFVDLDKININFLKQKIKNVFSIEVQNNSDNFWSLTPNDYIEVRESYKKALDFAFDKKNYIHNLGITGNLGIGKTSVIQSYLRKCNIRWIGVSLWDFAYDNKRNRTLELEKKILLQLMVSQTKQCNMKKIFSWLFLFIVSNIFWGYYIGFPAPVSKITAERISKAAKETAKERHNPEKIKNRMLKIYREIVSS